MDIPHIKVGPYLYKVVKIPNLKNDEGEDLYGEIDHQKFEIRLAADNPDQLRLPALWHEVIHAFEAVYHLEFEEAEVALLTTAIVSALYDNPVLNGPAGLAPKTVTQEQLERLKEKLKDAFPYGLPDRELEWQSIYGEPVIFPGARTDGDQGEEKNEPR